jgi:hypothetical protein
MKNYFDFEEILIFNKDFKLKYLVYINEIN